LHKLDLADSGRYLRQIDANNRNWLNNNPSVSFSEKDREILRMPVDSGQQQKNNLRLHEGQAIFAGGTAPAAFPLNDRAIKHS